MCVLILLYMCPHSYMYVSSQALIAALTKFLKVHNSVQGYDKTVKLFYYALPLAASTLRSVYKDSPLAEGLAAIGSHLVYVLYMYIHIYI